MSKGMPPLVLPQQQANSNSIDYYLQPLTFRVSNDTLSDPSTSNLDQRLKRFTKRVNRKCLLEQRNNILWVWDFSPVAEWKNDIVVRKHFTQIQRKSSKRKKHQAQTGFEYVMTQDERLRRCRVGSSLVKKLVKPVYEQELHHVFNIPASLYKKKIEEKSSFLPPIDSTFSDIIDNQKNTESKQIQSRMWQKIRKSHIRSVESSHENNEDTSQYSKEELGPHAKKLGNFFKGIVDAKIAFLKSKDKVDESDTHTDTFSSEIALQYDILNRQAFDFQLPSQNSKGRRTNFHDSNEPAFAQKLSDEERSFISQFGTVQYAKNCEPLIDSKIAADFPLLTTVHVKLRSWSDIVRISRLQKQREWEKYLSDRESDRNCVLGQSSQLAIVCDRAMKAAENWRSDRIMGNTMVDLKKKKSLWLGPAAQYREKLEAHNHRNEFFSFMLRGCAESTDIVQKTMFSRKEESRKKLIWALFLLRAYMMAGWNVDETLFFHFCEVFGYSTHQDYQLMFFFDRFQRQAGVNPQNLKEYRQSIEDERRSAFIKKHFNISNEDIIAFLPLKEKAHQEFLEAIGEDVFVTSLPYLK